MGGSAAFCYLPLVGIEPEDHTKGRQSARGSDSWSEVGARSPLDAGCCTARPEWYSRCRGTTSMRCPPRCQDERLRIWGARRLFEQSRRSAPARNVCDLLRRPPRAAVSLRERPRSASPPGPWPSAHPSPPRSTAGTAESPGPGGSHVAARRAPRARFRRLLRRAAIRMPRPVR